MNHGPRFWGTVASVIPTYADERERLNQVQWPVW
jgi:predicted metal-dependent hydrolase